MSSIKGDISTRVRAVIEKMTSEKGRVKELERLTGISASSWKNFLNGQQKATVAMVESISQTAPDMAFWIATGSSDDQYGHVSPEWYSTHHYKGKTNTSSVRYFLAEITSCRTKETQAKIDGLDVLYKLDLITVDRNDPKPTTDQAAFFKELRTIHIFLDSLLQHLRLETAIDAFNELNGKRMKLEHQAEQLGELNAYNELLAHFKEKRAEIEDWNKKITEEIVERAKAQMNNSENNGNSEN